MTTDVINGRPLINFRFLSSSLNLYYFNNSKQNMVYSSLHSNYPRQRPACCVLLQSCSVARVRLGCPVFLPRWLTCGRQYPAGSADPLAIERSFEGGRCPMRGIAELWCWPPTRDYEVPEQCLKICPHFDAALKKITQNFVIKFERSNQENETHKNWNVSIPPDTSAETQGKTATDFEP